MCLGGDEMRISCDAKWKRDGQKEWVRKRRREKERERGERRQVERQVEAGGRTGEVRGYVVRANKEVHEQVYLNRQDTRA